MENRELFESMPVSKALARLAVPTIVSQLITMVYNLADTFFIGSTKEPYKVAAATLAYTLFFILNALSNHFGIGGGSLISRLLGDGKPEEAKGVCSFSFYGSAVATMLSNVAAVIYFAVVYFRLRGTTVLSLSPRRITAGARHVGVIFAVGFPSAIGNLLSCVANMVINKLASGYGDIAVAALGIVKKIEMLPMNLGMGLCQGTLPLVAYNYASKNFARMKEAVKKASLSGMGFALLCVLVFELFAQTSIRIFIDDAQTVSMGAVFLRINCLATPLMICNFHISFMFQAVGKGPQSLLLSSCRTGLVHIPMLYVMNALAGLNGLAWTQVISDGVTLALALLLYRRFVREFEAAQ